MPTVKELHAELKAKGIKGYSGKSKAQLEAMLGGGKKLTPTEELEASIPKLKAAVEAMMKPSVAKVIKAAKPIAPHGLPVAVTATAKAPVRKPAPAAPAAPAAVPAPSKKEPEKKAKHLVSGDIEDYLHRLVKIYAVEEGLASDLGDGKGEADQWLEKINEKGEYNDYEAEAIQSFGGHDSVADKIMAYYTKKGYSEKSIIDAMKHMDEQYTMFDKYTKKEPEKKAAAYNPFDDEEEVVKAPVVKPVSAPVAESKKGTKKEGYVESGMSVIDIHKPVPGIPVEATRDVLKKPEDAIKIRKFITRPPKDATLQTLQKFAVTHLIEPYTTKHKTKSGLRAFIEEKLNNTRHLAFLYNHNRYAHSGGYSKAHSAK